MLNTILTIYLAGCAVTAVIFAVMLLWLYAQGSKDARIIFWWYLRIMPEYVLLWFWRCVIFPIWKWPEIRKITL
jgi:hypothetical protein